MRNRHFTGLPNGSFIKCTHKTPVSTSTGRSLQDAGLLGRVGEEKGTSETGQQKAKIKMDKRTQRLDRGRQDKALWRDKSDFEVF